MRKRGANKRNCTNTPEYKRQNNPLRIKINRFYFVLRAVWPNFVENIGDTPKVAAPVVARHSSMPPDSPLHCQATQCLRDDIPQTMP